MSGNKGETFAREQPLFSDASSGLRWGEGLEEVVLGLEEGAVVCGSESIMT